MMSVQLVIIQIRINLNIEDGLIMFLLY